MQLPNNTEASMILHAWQDAGRPDLRLVEKPEFADHEAADRTALARRMWAIQRDKGMGK